MRIVRFVFRNWPLKLGAILLAVMLYGGMQILQNTGSWTSQIPIEPKNQPTDSALLAPLGNVTQIRYVAAGDVPVTRDSFRAEVDLSSVQPGKPTVVKVELTATDPRIRILDYDPAAISVLLDPVIKKTMKVTLDHNTTPAGLTIGNPTVTPASVTVSGGQTYVNRVVTALASFAIESSGLDVDQNVNLQALDQNGNAVPSVEFEPPTVRVRLVVNSQARTVSLPVNAVVAGTPAEGYAVSGIDVLPVVVEVRGEAGLLDPLTKIDTAAVSVEGAKDDVTERVALNLPQGVEAPGVNTVKVVVHVKALTASRSISLGVIPDGARSDRTYQLSTANVTVTIAGQMATLNGLDSSTLTATVQVGSLDPGDHAVKVVISQLPANVKLVSVEPLQITVTVLSATSSPSPSASP